MPYDWQNSSAGSKHLRIIILSVITYSIFFVCHNVAKEVIILPLLAYILFISLILYVLYYDLMIRIKVPDAKEAISTTVQKEDSGDTDYENGIGTDNETCTLSEVARRLQKAVYHDAAWQNPDLCQEDLWRMIGTNRTYLQKAIKELGFNSYYDMLNQLRTEYVMRELRKKPEQNLQSLFFRAGYRSRATANRNFFIIAGCSPSEYVERNASINSTNDEVHQQRAETYSGL